MFNILVTGGAGFIGSNFLNFISEKHIFNEIVNVDKLTYAGDTNNVASLQHLSNYHFYQYDINDSPAIYKILKQFNINLIINFAAETHVDNSIRTPNVFVDTNVLGTANLLSAAKTAWSEGDFNISDCRYLQVSTDEVYGSLDDGCCEKKFTENTPLDPHSPYSASKAGADMLVKSYYDTYGFPVLITRCSNNYGRYQNFEKLIPLVIKNAYLNKSIPVYGDGMNVRDWIYVEDHCNAVLEVLLHGRVGEVYNIGGNCEVHNIDIVKKILDYMQKPYTLISYVADRLGHDRRYAIDYTKINNELGWSPSKSFEEHLHRTIDWYVNRMSNSEL